MGTYFFDTSALVKRYHQESGTDVVEKTFQEIGASFVISRLGIVELTSAFALKVRTSKISPTGFIDSAQKVSG